MRKNAFTNFCVIPSLGAPLERRGEEGAGCADEDGEVRGDSSIFADPGESVAGLVFHHSERGNLLPHAQHEFDGHRAVGVRDQREARFPGDRAVMAGELGEVAHRGGHDGVRSEPVGAAGRLGIRARHAQDDRQTASAGDGDHELSLILEGPNDSVDAGDGFRLPGSAQDREDPTEQIAG